MKIQWFLSGLFGVLCMASPALAGELSTWQFDRSQNLLEFTTDEGVQPRAQLVPDPTRLVIDLPGTTIGNAPLSQLVGGAIQQVRIAQFNSNTARIVVELAPGYIIDPQQIQFRGISATEWVVQVPEPQFVGVTPTTTPNPSNPSAPTPAPLSSIAPPSTPTFPSPPSSTPAPTASVTSPPPVTPIDPSLTQIESLRATDDGLFIKISGARPEEVDVDRSRDRRSITIELDNTVLSPQFGQADLPLDRFGISHMEFKQTDDEPSRVEITLTVDRDSPNWRASVSGLGGIVLLPQERVASSRNSRRNRDRDRRNESAASATPATPTTEPPTNSSQQPEVAPSQPATPAVATIQGVEFDASGTQLLIRSDRPVAYTGRWQSGLYEISLSPAQLAAQVAGPELNANSPLLRVRLRQEEDDTVLVSLQPASGVRFGSLNAVTPQMLALEMQRSTASAPVAPSASTSSTPSTPSRTNPNIALPRVPNGRIVVVIDPGHGGPDVGAVGINNIYEADIVLSISQQVANLLQQQGIQVVMTRTDDIDLDLEPRVQMAEQVNATVFVSIHANSMGMDRPDVNGTETYYYSSGEALAEVIQNSIASNLDVNDRGVKQARFYVLRRTSMPAVLVETGYVTGSEDGPRLANSTFQTQMARAIAQGILTYLQQNSTVGQ